MLLQLHDIIEKMLFLRCFIILAQWHKRPFMTELSRRGLWGGCVDSVRKS